MRGLLFFFLFLTACGAFASAATGCATPAQEPLGASVRQAVAAQTPNPAAGGTEPVSGLDGRAAETVVGKYREGFESSGQEQGAGGAMQMFLQGGK